jgi:leucyl aminopeptidase (aminopeptidase T)
MIRCVTIVSAAVLWANSSHGWAQTLPCASPAWDNMAQTMIRQTARINRGESVVILHDPELNAGLIDAVRDAVMARGAVILAEVPRPDEAEQTRILALPPEDRAALQGAEDRAYTRLLSNTDVLLWLDGSVASDMPKRWERLLWAAPTVRAVHFHWFMPDNASEQCEVARIYERAIAADPEELRARQSSMVSSLRGMTARLTSPDGTNLTLSFPTTARFNMNDGITTREDVSRALSVRDREEELPSSAIRTTQFSADGVIVARLLSGNATDRVRVRFVAGRVVELSGSGEAYERFRRAYDARGGDRDRVAEFLLGMNSALTRIMPSGYLPYYGTGGGSIHIRIGDNWESGGGNVVPGHWQGIFVVSDGTLSVNGRNLVRGGDLAQ